MTISDVIMLICIYSALTAILHGLIWDWLTERKPPNRVFWLSLAAVYIFGWLTILEIYHAFN